MGGRGANPEMVAKSNWTFLNLFRLLGSSRAEAKTKNSRTPDSMTHWEEVQLLVELASDTSSTHVCAELIIAMLLENVLSIPVR